MLTIKSGELIAKTEELKEANTSLLASNGALKDRRDVLKVIYFPKGSSEFNAVEECWRQGKYDLLVSKYYPRFKNLTYAIGYPDEKPEKLERIDLNALVHYEKYRGSSSR